MSMSMYDTDKKLNQLESAYVVAIDSALARRDFATAQKLGNEWDRRAARRSRFARGA